MDRWLPIIGVLVGFLTATAGFITATVTEYFKYRRARADRRAEFQQQTLLELQDSLAELARATGAAHHHTDMTFRQTGQWGTKLPPEWNQKLFDAGVRTRILKDRVADDMLRRLVEQYRQVSQRATLALSQAEAYAAMTEFMTAIQTVNDRLGEVLRSLY